MEYVKQSRCDLTPAFNLALNEKVHKMKGDGMEIDHLGFGQSPFSIPKFAQEALCKNADKGGYLAVKGLLEVRELICSFHSRLDGLDNYCPDDVIIGPGSKELIFLLMNVIRGDVYLLSPTWTTYSPQALLSGKKSHIIKTSEKYSWKLTPGQLEPFAKEAVPGSLLVFCNPDNPTGACYTKEELRALAEVIRKSNLLVVCDEIYARLTYDGNHSTLCEFLPDRTILSSGISKWASCGGWRFGYHVFPKELRAVLNAVEAIASNAYTCASAPIQYAAVSLMKFDEKALEYTKHCSRILSEVAKYCARKLTKAGVKVVAPGAGYYMFPDFAHFRERFNMRKITTGEEMCEAIMKEARVALLAGGPAFLRERSCFTVRLCFINFNGEAAMKASQEIGLQNQLSEEFVEAYCKETANAIRRIVQWLDGVPKETTKV